MTLGQRWTSGRRGPLWFSTVRWHTAGFPASQDGGHVHWDAWDWISEKWFKQKLWKDGILRWSKIFRRFFAKLPFPGSLWKVSLMIWADPHKYSTLSDRVDRHCLFAKKDLEKCIRFWQQPGAGITQLWQVALSQATVGGWIPDQRSSSSLERSPSLESAMNCWWKGPKLSSLIWESFSDPTSTLFHFSLEFSRCLKGQAQVKGSVIEDATGRQGRSGF